MKLIEELERAVMQVLLADNDPDARALRAQFQMAKVSKREFSGVGFFTTFSVPDEAPRLTSRTKSDWHKGAFAELEGVQHGAGFTLFLKEGRIDILEGYTFDDPWPEHIGRFSVKVVDFEQT
jgi:hypothetical protein